MTTNYCGPVAVWWWCGGATMLLLALGVRAEPTPVVMWHGMGK